MELMIEPNYDFEALESSLVDCCVADVDCTLCGCVDFTICGVDN